jgi:hypothetical protein
MLFPNNRKLFPTFAHKEIYNYKMDKKKYIAIGGVLLAVLCLIIGILFVRMYNQKKESDQLLELAEMNKREMENEYEQFAMQYNEMKANQQRLACCAIGNRTETHRGTFGRAQARKEQQCRRDYAFEKRIGHPATSIA